MPSQSQFSKFAKILLRPKPKSPGMIDFPLMKALTRSISSMPKSKALTPQHQLHAQIEGSHPRSISSMPTSKVLPSTHSLSQ